MFDLEVESLLIVVVTHTMTLMIVKLDLEDEALFVVVVTHTVS